MTFSDNPTLAPKGAAVEVRSYITSAASGDGFATPIMQRAFAQRLAVELGLGDDLTAERAAATLAKVGIAPGLVSLLPVPPSRAGSLSTRSRP